MESRGFLKDEDLPQQFINSIVKSGEDVTEIRSSVNSVSQISDWIEEFGRTTNTSWVLKDSCPTETAKLSCRREYVCQHSSYRKSKVKNLKNCECKAFIRIAVKLTTASTIRKDKFVKDGLPAKISISNHHSHSLTAASALKYLKPNADLRALFLKYFNNGLNISDAIIFHESTFEEYSDVEGCLAKGNLNPKRRTVEYWFNQWRKENFGSRSEKDIYEVLLSKQEAYEEKGIKIQFSRDPLAIVVITPLMQRAHQLPMAKDIVFIDSTASCDAENHAVTFLLTPCVAGAVPLGIIITGGQTTKDYVAGFQLFEKTVKEPFGGVGYPVNFMTDDSAAEREALETVWGESNRYLCHFHISQAVWRWLRLKEHQIEANDRQSLYRYFKDIMVSATEKEVDEKFGSFMCSDLAKKYPNFTTYANRYMNRKEDWVLAYRNVATHNHNTNNFCEASVRLFKDLVLSRTKAYNAVALVDYTSILLEDYYVRRLRKFAHDRCSSPRLVLNSMFARAAYVKEEEIDDLGNGQFLVPSQKKSEEKYTVDTQLGSCTCPAGLFGGFCKHQAAVCYYSQISSPSMPGVTTAARYEMAILAFGAGCKAKYFYEPMRPEEDSMEVHETEGPTSTQSQISLLFPEAIALEKDDVEAMDEDVQASIEDLASAQTLPKAPTAPMDDEATHEDMQALMEAEMKCHARFGTSKSSINRRIRRLGQITTRNGWEAFLSPSDGYIGSYRRGKIRVQPTSISRRRAGVTKGCRRIPAGRPVKSDNSRKKRKRDLATNVKNNVDNAKSH